MKKTLKLALCGLMLAGAMNAQVATLPNGYYGDFNFEESWGTHPKAFSADGKAKLFSTVISKDGNAKINIYNSSFNIEHSFDIAPQVFQSKHIEERRAYVEVPGELQTQDLTNNVEEEWLNWWKSANQEARIDYWRDYKYRILEGFDTYIRFDRDSIYADNNGDIYIYLQEFDYDYSLKITSCIVLSNTTITYQPITYQRIGEWVVDESETREGEMLNYMTEIWNVVNIDDDWAYEIERPLLATQNIFNTDGKYEYLRYKYTTFSNRFIGESDQNGDGIADVRSFESGYERVGLEVVSEDGNVITSFDVGDVEEATLLLWDEKRYLGFYIYGEDNDSYQIYEINPNGSGITRANSAAFMHILPAMPKKNTSVTVEFGEESVKKGGQLMITDMNGRTVYRNAVAPGETSVRVPLRRMESGVYNVTLTNDGKKMETSKLIVR